METSETNTYIQTHVETGYQDRSNRNKNVQPTGTKSQDGVLQGTNKTGNSEMSNSSNERNSRVMNFSRWNKANDMKDMEACKIHGHSMEIQNRGNGHNGGNGEHFHKEEHHINQKVSNRHKILTSFIAGGLAGAIAKTTIAPLDRTKINFQISNMKFSFRKALQFLVKTYKTEGALALWRGNSATMVRIVPYAAVQYTAHEQYKLLLNHGKRRKHLPPHLRALAGSLAGITATTLTYPLDFARARMAVTAKDRYSSIMVVYRTVLKEEGWRVIVRGFAPTVSGSCIYSGISFFLYETQKKIHAEYHKGRDPTPLERWYFGAVAGLCGQCSSYPLDIVRRRMQTAGVTGHSKDYTSIFRTAKIVYMKEGLKGGLYKGLSMNWIKGPISAGISFMVFEQVQRWLRMWPVFHIEPE